MRYLALILALAAAILLTGCSSLISLNPFVADASTTTDPALLGAWKTTESGDPSVLWIRQKGPLYTIRYDGEDKDGKAESARFEGRLTRVGDADDSPLLATGHWFFRP